MIREHAPTFQHNFEVIVAFMQGAGEIYDGPIVIDVHHDSWCDIFRGGYCNCDPVINFSMEPTEETAPCVA
jgi:hypothetical protein